MLNPPCYKTVEACGSGNGCKRVGYSQLCAECDADEGCETGGSGFQYPTLEKAFTTLSDSETMGSVGGSSEAATSSSDAGSSGSNSVVPGLEEEKASESSSEVTTATIIGIICGGIVAVLVLVGAIVICRCRSKGKHEEQSH